jgi:hypothetical protein
MGNGIWNSGSYAKSTGAKISSGTTFTYDRTAKASGTYKAHADLDPKIVAGPTSPFAGQVMRESRDNAEHPNSVPIALFADVTGSMGKVPRVFQTKLGGLFGLLLRKGYVEDPQIMIGAYGDAQTDRVPLQASQFESDNRIDECLDNMFIEGNGGGNGGETMSLAWYYLANHTATDAYEKRGKKGYAFFVADEISLPVLEDRWVTDAIGVGQPESALDVNTLADKVKERWDVYILLIDNMSAKIQRSEEFYVNLFGRDHVLVVEDPDAITETIALTIGVLEGTVDLDDAVDDLKETGTTEVSLRSATKSVAGLQNLAGRGAVAKTNARLDFDSAGTSAARL